jgi:hypothetical protein
MAETKPVQMWRYYITGEGPLGGGWAEVVVVSTGMFAAVSDYGDYAHAWRCPGEGGIRAFLADKRSDYDYFARKFAGERRDWDGEATTKAVKRFLGQEYRDKNIDADTVREVLEEIRDANGFHERHDFDDWVTESVLADEEHGYDCYALGTLAEMVIPQDIVAFCELIMPKLAAMIRDELAREGAAA